MTTNDPFSVLRNRAFPVTILEHTGCISAPSQGMVPCALSGMMDKSETHTRRTQTKGRFGDTAFGNIGKGFDSSFSVISFFG